MNSLILLIMLLPLVNATLHPVVIIPGSGGNQLEARLTDDYKPSSLLCHPIGRRRKGSWFRLWFDPTVLLPPLMPCFAERMTLYYDEDTDDYRNAPGVETMVPYFGSTQGLRSLDPSLKLITGYMDKLVDSLEQIGYKDSENLFGAPYDFRYGLSSTVGIRYLHNLKTLIESASSSSNKPVILLSHSLGGLFALQLLSNSTPSWRARHILHLITLSSPWGGTVQEMLTFASGYTLGIPLVDPLAVRDEQRSSESNLLLLPSPALFKSKPLVTTPTRNFSANQMPDFLKAIGYEGVTPYRKRVINKLGDPGVGVTCIVGCGVETAERLVYGEGGFDELKEMEYGDGDGTVNMESLLWMGESYEGVKVVKVEGVSHTDVLKDEGALREVVEEICRLNSDVLSTSSV